MKWLLRKKFNADKYFGGGSVPFDLNQFPIAGISTSGGEDNTSDSDADEPSSKREKTQSRTKRKNGELSNVERIVEHQDVEIPVVIAEEAPINLTPARKRKKGKNWKRGDSKPVLLWHAWEEEHEKWIDQNLLEDVNSGHQSEVMNETAEPSSDLTVPLLRYQREWLAWALKQENSATRGGILADEMGMGKTIQAIALVLAKREFHQMGCEPDEFSHSPGSSKVLPMIKGTLVICPVVAVSQWLSEINRFTLTGSTKVLIYHGAKRDRSAEQFSDFDFVITTYSIVESEYRKRMMPPKEKCPYCGKLYYQNKLPYHQKYYCGPDAVRTAKQSKQTKKKLSEKQPKQPKHKRGRRSKLEQGHLKEKEDEMCLGTEESAAIGSEKSFLHAVKWQRIILDEVSCDTVLWLQSNQMILPFF